MAHKRFSEILSGITTFMPHFFLKEFCEKISRYRELIMQNGNEIAHHTGNAQKTSLKFPDGGGGWGDAWHGAEGRKLLA